MKPEAGELDRKDVKKDSVDLTPSVLKGIKQKRERKKNHVYGRQSPWCRNRCNLSSL